MNDVATKQSGRSASQVPISQHPAFPAIVALWFAALLGIGSLVLPASLFEAALDASGLASALPGAEPPLGVTARILIALVAAALGVTAGLFVARKVAAAQGRTAPAPHRAEHAGSVKRPISAHEELWSEGFDEPVEDARRAPIAGRRRALSVTDESGPSDLLDGAPLPGSETEIDFADAPPAPEPVETPAEEDALELAAFAESVEIVSDFEPAEPPVPAFAETHDEDREPALEHTAIIPEPGLSSELARPFDAPASPPASLAAPFSEPESDAPESVDTVEPVDEPQECEPISTTGSEAQEPALGELSIAELVERFALSLQHAAERAAAEAEIEAQAAADEVELPPRYVPDLGVEAIEAPRFTPAPEPLAAQADEEPAEEPVEEPATAIPAALRPVAFGEDEADEGEGEEFSLTLSLAHEARPFDRPAVSPAPVAQGEPEGAGDAPDHGYSSLLDMRMQAASREFVRIEDEAPAADAAEDEAIEPVVVFPGQDQRRTAPAAERSADGQSASAERPFAAPASASQRGSDSMQTERALREALHKLQRLSGAA